MSQNQIPNAGPVRAYVDLENPGARARASVKGVQPQPRSQDMYKNLSIFLALLLGGVILVLAWDPSVAEKTKRGFSLEPRLRCGNSKDVGGSPRRCEKAAVPGYEIASSPCCIQCTLEEIEFIPYRYMQRSDVKWNGEWVTNAANDNIIIGGGFGGSMHEQGGERHSRKTWMEEMRQQHYLTSSNCVRCCEADPVEGYGIAPFGDFMDILYSKVKPCCINCALEEIKGLGYTYMQRSHVKYNGKWVTHAANDNIILGDDKKGNQFALFEWVKKQKAAL